MDLLIGGGKAHAAVAVALIFIRSEFDELAIFMLDASVWHGCRAAKLAAPAARPTTCFDNGVDTVEKSSFMWPLIVSEAMRVSVFSLLCGVSCTSG